MISAIIGFPAEDAVQIQVWTDDVNTLWNMLAPVETRVAAARRMADYTHYLQALIEDRRVHPREDLLSDLVHGANGYTGLADEYIHNIIRGAARVAGFDTTRDAITATMLLVLQDPEVHEHVLTDPAKHIPRLTEEALRRDAPHRGLFRESGSGGRADRGCRDSSDRLGVDGLTVGAPRRTMSPPDDGDWGGP